MRRLLISHHQNVTYISLILEVTKSHAQGNYLRRHGGVVWKCSAAMQSRTNRTCYFGIQNEPTQRAFASHSNTNYYDNNAPSSTPLQITVNVHSSVSIDERYQLEKMKSQKPSKRYVDNRSDQEWEHVHTAIMQKNSLEVMDIIDAEQCMRWWISQSRACLQKTRNERTRVNRLKGQQRFTATTNTSNRSIAAKAIVSALDLFGHVVAAIEMKPELLQFDHIGTGATSDTAMRHWYVGHLPRATHLLNAILDAWRLCWIDLERENTLLPTPQEIFTLLKDNWCDHVPMNERTYSIVMDAPVAAISLFNNATTQQEVPIFCEKVINFMLERKVPKNISEHTRTFYAEQSTLPDNVTYATALNAWARSGRNDAAKRAEILFNQFTTFCSNGTLPTWPNTFCYNTVLVAMSTPPATSINQRWILLKNATKSEQTLDQSIVDDVLRHQDALVLAEDMFRSMQFCPYPNVMPDSVSFRTLIFAWAEYSVDLRYVDRLKSQNAMNRAVTLLYEMAQLRVASGNTAIDINYSFFGKIISTLALNQPLDIDHFAQADFRRAEEVYQYMLNLYRSTRDERFTPDASLLCAMTLVYAKGGRPLEAEAILTRLENEARSRNQLSLLPRISYYCDTLEACMKLAVKEMKCGKQEPASVAADKAESLIIRMVDVANVTGDAKNLPKRIIIHNMFDVWILCQLPQRAENFYRCIESLYEATQCQHLRWKPNHLRHLLYAWANNGNDSTFFSAQQAENILQEMQKKFELSREVGFRPSAMSISFVIGAWLRTEHNELVAKCRGLFDQAVAAYGAGNDQARPDTALYGSVLKAFSRVGDGEGAMDFLEIMKNDYTHNSNHSAKPNIGIFNMVLLSWLKSNDVNAPKHALDLFKIMESSAVKEKLGIEPDYRTFSIICEILASSKGQGYEEDYNFFLEQRNRLEKTTSS